ncbi:hypothetical protein BX661DRAFT_171227 [Kickxella alabastrina]|uniref:uncharacterized protein n=1 Tax=Kickxella alabastrina TaxID=61397 RepID=UPI002220258A|nr:uncharacterized protein BX661DRAFT_171227 [Kickxella alabastrina]KAI7827289.1 hypothetical protein BX661DRAFT_171227 [Kickxella alabastrina]
MDSIAASTAGQMDSACLGDTERTPLLLPRNHRTSVAGSTFASFGDDTTQQTTSIVTREVKHVADSFIRSPGRNELGGIGLAHMVVILTGYPVLFSVLNCLETCASQAYTSVQPQLVGAYFVQAMQVQWAMGLVLGALWFSAEPLLTHFMHGTNLEMVAMAAAYLRWYFVPFMLFGTLMCAKQLLFSQGVTYPLPYLTLLGTVVTLSAQYLLVFSPYFSLGVRGIALANGLSYLAMLLATFWVVRRHNVSRIWGGLRVRAPWKSFLRLMPPSLVLTVLSTGTSELITMAATQLGGSSLTIQAVISALSRMFMIAFSSIGVAALNRAGNLIGHRSVRGAKISSTVSLCLGLIFAFLGAFAILWSPETWIRIFTNDEQTVQGAKEVLPVAILAAFGAGQAGFGHAHQFVMLYVVGLPLGYYWAIVSGHGLVGLWSAVAVGQTCTALVEAVVMLKTDWVRLVDYCTETIIMP